MSESGSRTVAAFNRAQQEARVRSSGVGIPAYPARSAPRSGIMPDASGLVLCPHCRKGFPFSAALLDRQIRCNGCRGVFRVAADRRSFRLQPPPSPLADATLETTTASGAARTAIRQANDSLNETARRMLLSIDRKGPPTPIKQRPASDPMIATAAPAITATRRIVRTETPKAVLSGNGTSNARRRNLWSAVITVAVVLLAMSWWSAGGDIRRSTLVNFQSPSRLDLGLGERLAELRARSLSREVEAIVDIDRAVFTQPTTLDLQGLRSALNGKRILRRNEMWVEVARAGEAEAMLAQSGSMAATLANCRKAGIDIRSWDEVVAMASAALPLESKDVFRLLFDRPAPRLGGFDPVALLDQGRLPNSIDLCGFNGREGGLLQQVGPPRRQAYRGRLIRCTGTGWPGTWQVLDLTASPP
jgi:hypothetical protein